MKAPDFDYGMIGLGTMGRNLIYNMCDHGYSLAGFDKDASKINILEDQAAGRKVKGTPNLIDFFAALKSPKVILLLVPAGPVVDAVIQEIKPFLSKDDLVIDCGNSHFTDTDLRIQQLAKEHIHFMGIGISGGESGARNGPSIMPGGKKEVYEFIAPMLESIAAKVNGQPCVTWLGPGSAGHYVKMLHNGIEYGLMQLIAETYHLLKSAGKLNNDELHHTFLKWNEGFLQSFLIEITAGIFLQRDEHSQNRLVDMILDRAQQKGTGSWTSEDALHLQVPIPVVDIAVTMRNMSALKKEREVAFKKLIGPNIKLTDEKAELINRLERALYFAMITVYAQGMALLKAASQKYNYDLKLENIAMIWRGGCIIRAALLEDIHTAFSQEPDLPNLMVNNKLAAKLQNSEKEIRFIIKEAIDNGIPMPAMMMSLAYYDSYRSDWLPANLLQAQRDYFGAHTYERIDREGIFHTQWNQNTS